MTKTLYVGIALVLATALSSASHVERIHAHLTGFQEVPSVVTPADGEFKAQISSDGSTIEYELTYSGLVGTVQQSHIHIAQKAVSGSIVIWLCQTATTQAPPAVAGLTPMCPQSGSVSGTITAANVIAASTTSQQVTAGQLDKVIEAIRAGVAYANVHSTPLNPAGEIRGQIRVDEGDKDDKDHDHH
ncbi:MAG TPA: CHRD domain-containing protein [Vicinamibacterales bacterium]|nr:CHRD domain-containing protein [Vicinamibacterales bacterium]